MLLDFSKEFDVLKARAWVERKIAKKAKAELKDYREQRTLDQNAYMHVCLAMFCAETGYTRNEALDSFSYQLPDLMRYEKHGLNFRKSTADLDTKEMGILIDTIRQLSMDNLGLYIPESEVYLKNQFELRKDTESVK